MDKINEAYQSALTEQYIKSDPEYVEDVADDVIVALQRNMNKVLGSKQTALMKKIMAEVKSLGLKEKDVIEAMKNRFEGDSKDTMAEELFDIYTGS